MSFFTFIHLKKINIFFLSKIFDCVLKKVWLTTLFYIFNKSLLQHVKNILYICIVNKQMLKQK